MAELKIKADSGGGTVSFKGPSTTTSNAAVQLTLPVDDGAADTFLKSNGSGVLSWASAADATKLPLAGGTMTGTLTAKSIGIQSGSYVYGSSGMKLYGDGSDNDTKLVQIVDGNVKVASGKGIDFSATSDGTIGGDGGGRSEVLDDYEYGRWTPTCKSDGTITSPYNCHYHKVGNRVWVCGFIRQFSNDSAGNSINIEGLPFAVEGYEWTTKSKAAGSCGTLYMDLAAHQSYANGGDHIEFQASSSASWNMLKHSHINHANHLIMFDCTYLTS